MTPRHLAAVSTETGEIHESREDLLAGQLAETEAALARSERSNSVLRGQLGALKNRDVRNEATVEVMQHWLKVCRAGSARVKIPTDSKRADAVRRMLATFKPGELIEAVNKAALMPFEQYGRHYCEAAPGRTRRDDLIYLMADVSRVEKLRDLRPEPEHDAYRRWLAGEVRADPMFVVFLAHLAEREPHGEVIASAARWARTQEPRA